MVFFCCLALALIIAAPTLWWWHSGTCLLGYYFARYKARQYFIPSGQLGVLPEQGLVFVSASQQHWQGQLKAAHLYFHSALVLSVKTEQGTRHIGVMRHAMDEQYWRQLCRQVLQMI
ncbi:protein YgfX [Pseudoalteromonas rubra]|uniref:protein YgfX n=1 Tax=Pseudoalteromonas rubra TaxID=43658 RepID=UPI00138E1DE7|nr:protein YgfX [Pseudoalteromonas rubra]